MTTSETRQSARRLNHTPGVARIAVIGTGMMGALHAERVASSPTADLAVLCSIDDAGQPLAERLGVHLVADYRDLISIDVDGVIIATPNRLHYPMAMFFIEHGIAVLIEKPIADTVAEAFEICVAAERAGVPVLVGHHRRHKPLLPLARMLVETRLGKVLGTSTIVAVRKPDSYYEPEWRRQAEAGPLRVNLVHEVDLLRAVCGEIVAVQSADRTLHRTWEFPDTAAILLHYESEAVGTIFLSESASSPWSWESSVGDGLGFYDTGQDYLRIMGTNGALALPSLTLWTYGADAEPGWLAPLLPSGTETPRDDPYARQVTHFAHVALRSEVPLVNGWDALRSLAVVEAVIEAGRTRSVVQVDSVIEAATGHSRPAP